MYFSSPALLLFSLLTETLLFFSSRGIRQGVYLQKRQNKTRIWEQNVNPCKTNAISYTSAKLLAVTCSPRRLKAHTEPNVLIQHNRCRRCRPDSKPLHPPRVFIIVKDVTPASLRDKIYRMMMSDIRLHRDTGTYLSSHTHTHAHLPANCARSPRKTQHHVSFKAILSYIVFIYTFYLQFYSIQNLLCTYFYNSTTTTPVTCTL